VQHQEVECYETLHFQSHDFVRNFLLDTYNENYLVIGGTVGLDETRPKSII